MLHPSTDHLQNSEPESQTRSESATIAEDQPIRGRSADRDRRAEPAVQGATAIQRELGPKDLQRHERGAQTTVQVRVQRHRPIASDGEREDQLARGTAAPGPGAEHGEHPPGGDAAGRQQQSHLHLHHRDRALPTFLRRRRLLRHEPARHRRLRSRLSPFLEDCRAHDVRYYHAVRHRRRQRRRYPVQGPGHVATVQEPEKETV